MGFNLGFKGLTEYYYGELEEADEAVVSDVTASVSSGASNHNGRLQ